MDYRFSEDLQLVLELLRCSKKELAAQLGTSTMTLDRWIKGLSQPRTSALEGFYDYAFSRGIDLNRIKAQLYQEELGRASEIALFHGSKSGIEGPLSASASRANNDFGQGFYCGETLAQSAMFITAFPRSSLYMIAFNPAGLSCLSFAVDRHWMLTIASFRGRLKDYDNHPVICELRRNVSAADYLIAPIADNRMYEVIDQFIDGEITDLQCEHSLSATDLGRQYVFTTERALEQVRVLEHCFLGQRERRHYEAERSESTRIGLTKAKAARRQYRGQGLYIEELLS